MRARKFEETAIALSLLCDTPIDVVERALLEPAAEIVLILANVAGLSSTKNKAILLLRAADRGMSAQDLEHALSSFNRLQPDTARRVLGFFRTRVKKLAQPTVPPAVAVNGKRRARRRAAGRRLSRRSNRAGSAPSRRSGSGSSSRRSTNNSRRCGAALQRQ